MIRTLFILPVLMFAFTAGAFASDDQSTNCKLSGLYSTPGLVHLPWDRKKEAYSVDSLERCLDAAKTLLEYKFEGQQRKCVHRHRVSCETLTVVTTIKAVKFKYIENGYTIQGELKQQD